MSELHGIDISEHNGVVDFKKVKAAGKSFVFLRLGWAGYDGKIVDNKGLDRRFFTNLTNALAAGLNVGVYVYSYCKTPAAAKIAAQETLDLVKSYKLTYPIAFDIEDTSATRYDQMSKADNNAIVAAFLDEIEAANYYGMLYTYKSFAENYLDMSKLGKYDFWLAQYANKVTYKGSYGIWQHKGDVPGFVGYCPGVTGACDLNISYKDYASLIAVTGLNNASKETTKSLIAQLKELVGKIESSLE